ncbi:MAG TPA: AMP-binding protein, partial [Spirochaetota bacterium]|nr:AMP-binding protein [Spirochaetota bacterium]
SGTTGNSKGVMLTYGNIMTNVRWTNDSKRINESDVMIAILPTHHSWPLIGTILCPLDAGATTVFLKELSAEVMLKTIKENKITMITAVPRLFEMFHRSIMSKIEKVFVAKAMLGIMKFLYKIPFNKLIFGRVKVPYGKVDAIPLTRKVFKKIHDEFGGNIKVFISGGAKLNPQIIKDFMGMGITMIEGYGLTETSPMVTYHPFDDLHLGSVGKVFEQMEVKIDTDGEILFKGPNVMKGYWEKPEDTKNAFDENGFFKTGDLGFIDKNRFLYITGRKKDLIILANGKNVRPDVIEEKIKAQFPLIEDIAVYESSGAINAVIMPNLKFAKENGISNLKETIKWEVIDAYNKLVENYKKIKDFIITNLEFPKTRMGKVQRYKLKEFAEKNSIESKNKGKETSPQFEEYSLICEEIAEITGINPNPSDHFEIDLGFDSVSFIELQVFIEKTFGIKFEQETISKYPTIISLAEYVRDAKTKIDTEKVDWKMLLSSETDWTPSKKSWILNWVSNWFLFSFKKKLNIKSTGLSNIPEGPCILAANHESFMDGILIYSQLDKKTKRDLYFFAKEKHFRKGILKFFADRSHVVLMDINKNIQESLRQIAKVLQDGKKVLIFPEGTRTRDGIMNKFKKTFATMSKVLNVPVVPVAIKGAYQSMPTSRRIPRKGNVLINFLNPIFPESLSENDILENTVKVIKICIGT